MATPTTSFRLPVETLDRLRALARPGESLSGVIVRAALALEAAPALTPPTDSTAALDALAARVARLEACIAPVAQMQDSRVTPATHLQHEQEQPVLQADTRATARPPRQGRPIYPQEVREMALAMADRGATPLAIRQAVDDACGHAPDSKNWSKVIAAWRQAAESQ
jgi:hypothetical protein